MRYLIILLVLIGCTSTNDEPTSTPMPVHLSDEDLEEYYEIQNLMDGFQNGTAKELFQLYGNDGIDSNDRKDGC